MTSFDRRKVYYKTNVWFDFHETIIFPSRYHHSEIENSNQQNVFTRTLRNINVLVITLSGRTDVVSFESKILQFYFLVAAVFTINIRCISTVYWNFGSCFPTPMWNLYTFVIVVNRSRRLLAEILSTRYTYINDVVQIYGIIKPHQHRGLKS